MVRDLFKKVSLEEQKVTNTSFTSFSIQVCFLKASRRSPAMRSFGFEVFLPVGGRGWGNGGHLVLLLIITGTLLSFVFLITASFVRECSRKCINPCRSAQRASCGLPADSHKKPRQVDQPFITGPANVMFKAQG